MTFIKALCEKDFFTCPDIFENKYIYDHLSNITSEKYKRESTAAYSLLAEMLGFHFGICIKDVDIVLNEYGKPLISGKDVCFNLSHSNGLVVCAVSNENVGVDVEFIRDVRPLIKKKCMTSREADSIIFPKDFYRIWTLKEAYFKYVGTGINRSMTDIEFVFDSGIHCFENGVLSSLTFKSFDFGEHIISLCTKDYEIFGDIILE